MRPISILLISIFSINVMASERGQNIVNEYNQIKKWAMQAKTNGTVGGLYPFAQMDGYTILFSKPFDGKHETIRIFLPGDEGKKDFAVTYIKSRYFEKGKLILRRFIGPEPTGWRMDAVDVETMEYLGFQGTTKPTIEPTAESILKEWEINLL